MDNDKKLLNSKGSMQCSNNNNRTRSRFGWKRLWSYFPAWMKSANANDPEKAATSKPCQSQALIIRRQSDQGCSEKKQETSRKASNEQVISNYNFEDVNIDQNICCERCQQKGLTVCGKHSSTAGPGSFKNIKSTIQVEVVGVPSMVSSKRKTSSRSCVCKKSLLIMNTESNPCAQQQWSVKDQPNVNNACQNSVLKQAWSYVETIIADHKSRCPRCKATCSSMESTTSNDSTCCKESLLNIARAYLHRITSDHKSVCTYCKQMPSYTILSFLQSMLDRAWLLLKTISSDHNQSCTEECKGLCNKRSSIHRPDINRSPGNLKYSSSCPKCSSGTNSLQGVPKNPSCPASNVRLKSCLSPCNKRSPLVSQYTPTEEEMNNHRSCSKPCSKSPSLDLPDLLGATGAIHNPRSLDRLIMKKLSSCIRPIQKTVQSVNVPDDPSACIDSCPKHSTESRVGQKVFEYCSSCRTQPVGACGTCNLDNESKQSTQSTGSCEKSDSDKGLKRTGIKISIEAKPKPAPVDGKSSPKDCTKDDDIPSPSKIACKSCCTGSCNPNYIPAPQPTCDGGCSSCNSGFTVAAMYQEEKEKQFGSPAPKKERNTGCNEDCVCNICKPLSDPYNYRYYY